MASAAATSPRSFRQPELPPKSFGGKRHRYTRVLIIAAFVVLTLLAAGAILVIAKWPFTASNIEAVLASAASGNVQIRGFRTTYFPPGCVLEGLEFRQRPGSGGQPLLTAARLTIRANYRGLLFKRIEVMRLEDVQVDMAQRARRSGSAEESGASNSSGGAPQSSADSVTIEEVVVDRAMIEFPRKAGPLRFQVHQLTLANFVRGKPTSFHVRLENPLPPGRVAVDGQFGPWNSSDVGATPLSGTYRFTDAKLSALGGIAGTLASQGSFAGPAKALRVNGSANLPDYAVKSAGHPVDLRTQFQAVVNCSNGDVDLQSVRGEFENTSFAVAGPVAGKTNPHSKVASLQVNDAAGRVEDWLRLLAPDQSPAMTGPISFQARVIVPGGSRPFIRRVRLVGDFELTGVGFTKEKSQHGASELSLRARGERVPNARVALPKILGTLSGHVELVDGVANFSTLTFILPGAMAHVHGTYSLIDENIDLHGQLRVDNKFSKTAGGPKGLVTRATETLFARSRGDGEILPVKMTGTYDHPSYGLDK